MIKIDNIDIKLFKEQRDTLNNIISSSDTNRLDAEQTEHLEGLQNLLDDIYDQLVPDNLGE